MLAVLRECDVGALLRLWPAWLPAPATREDALVTLHMTRTAAESMPDKARMYSHAWLTERGLPSLLPDRLKAERPLVVGAVGISVNSIHAEVKEAIHGVMRNAVMDAYANGDEAPEVVKRLMYEARARERKALGLSYVNRL